MDIKDGDIYPKYSFRLSHADKAWLDRELDALKAKFNAGADAASPVVTKNVLLMSALKRGLRFLREDVHARCIQKTIEVQADAPRVWAALTKLAMGDVTAAVPHEFMQFAWKETSCWFRLHPTAAGGTRVELVHSGWELFPETQAPALQREFDARWDVLLGQLSQAFAKA